MPLDECGGAGEGNKGRRSVEQQQQQQSKQDGLLTHTLDRLWMTRRAVRRGGGQVSERAVDRWCLGPLLSTVAGEGWWAVLGGLEVACSQPYA